MKKLKSKLNFLKEVLITFRHGAWSAGCEFYLDKPMLYVGRMFFDGWHYVLHVGPFWIGCDD